MTDDESRVTYGDIPSVMATGRKGVGVSNPTYDDYHLDDVDRDVLEDTIDSVRIYIWEDESDRIEEMMDMIGDLRRDYIYATGTVIPTEFRSEKPLSSEGLTGIQWAISLGYMDGGDDE